MSSWAHCIVLELYALFLTSMGSYLRNNVITKVILDLNLASMMEGNQLSGTGRSLFFKIHRQIGDEKNVYVNKK